MAQLALHGVSKRFGSVLAVDGVDLEIAHGEFVVLVGPSGCGKSTTLRMISGLERVTAGRILIGGHDVTNVAPARRGVAMVFQAYALFPHMTAAQNIGFGLRLAKVPKAEIARRVAEVAATPSDRGVARALPARALRRAAPARGHRAVHPSATRRSFCSTSRSPTSTPRSGCGCAWRSHGFATVSTPTMVYVTHDQTEAMTLADRIVVFNDGRIEQIGAPAELYDAPANRFVAGFIGAPAMNFIPAAIEATEGREPRVRFGPVSLPAGRLHDAAPGPITLGVRPEHLYIASAAEADFRGRVEIVEKLGAGVAGLSPDGFLGRTGHDPDLRATGCPARRRGSGPGGPRQVPPVRRDRGRLVGPSPSSAGARFRWSIPAA